MKLSLLHKFYFAKLKQIVKREHEEAEKGSQDQLLKVNFYIISYRLKLLDAYRN